MKLFAIALASTLASLATLSTAHADKKHDAVQPGEQKLSEKAALSIAKSRYPNSAIEDADLEREDGRLIWSIELRPGGSNDLLEVHVDAVTGEIIKEEDQSPGKQRSEAAADKN